MEFIIQWKTRIKVVFITSYQTLSRFQIGQFRASTQQLMLLLTSQSFGLLQWNEIQFVQCMKIH